MRHCELNPIELIWANAKGYVARNNTTFKMKDLQRLANEALDRITTDDWIRVVNYTVKLEDRIRELQGIIPEVEPLIINLDDTDTESDSDSDSNLKQIVITMLIKL